MASPRQLRKNLGAEAEEIAETHISWVFLTDKDAYKVKKPVNLGFLDFSTLELRKRACEAELELNRRLAPDVYLGLTPVKRDTNGRIHFNGRGETVDWAVHMRRLPEAERADRLVASGELRRAQVERLAEWVADFHGRARDGEEIARFGRAELIEANVRENFEQSRPFIRRYLGAGPASELEALQLSFARWQRSLLAARVAGHHIRDGHGDLRLQQIYLPAGGPPRILDCIEFNERFRYGDVASDLAFLAMDFQDQGRPDLAEALLGAYARASNDFDLYSVIDFYEAYRAHVRAKVSGMLARDRDAPPPLRERADEDAARLFRLALSIARGERRLNSPILIAVGGTVGSGKSTVAERISRLLGAPRTDADRTRKHQLGVRPTEFMGGERAKEAYSGERTELTYQELFRRAEVVLASRRAIILDASFRLARYRLQARRTARAAGAKFVFVECQASLETCRNRLLERESRPSVSDARADLLKGFTASFEPVRELEPEERVVIDTERPFSEGVTELVRSLSRS